MCWDPKDGELCINRAKSQECLMDARSGFDAQINGRFVVDWHRPDNSAVL